MKRATSWVAAAALAVVVVAVVARGQEVEQAVAAEAGTSAAATPAAGGTAGSAESQPSTAPAPAAPPLQPLWGSHATVGDPRNPVVVPEQAIRMEFDHALHLREGDLACADCHESVLTSRKASDFNMPSREACTLCHDPEEIPWDWGPGAASPALVMPTAHLKFSHAAHLDGHDDAACATCHPDVAGKALATRDDLPSMETCLSCHDGAKAPADCRTCHLNGRAGTIRTSFASGTLVPDDHGVHWLDRHGAAAERDMGQCASCHAQEDCLSCHEGSVAPTFHDADYLRLHPQEAHANDPPCASCHVVDRFCRDCHFRAQVTMNAPLSGGSGFHPEGWIGDPPGPEHHRHPARMNLTSCVGCHVKEDCIGCHAFSASSARVHPPGWAGSRRMRELRDANFAMCLNCHGFGEPGDPITVP